MFREVGQRGDAAVHLAQHHHHQVVALAVQGRVKLQDPAVLCEIVFQKTVRGERTMTGKSEGEGKGRVKLKIRRSMAGAMREGGDGRVRVMEGVMRRQRDGEGKVGTEGRVGDGGRQGRVCVEINYLEGHGHSLRSAAQRNNAMSAP